MTFMEWQMNQIRKHRKAKGLTQRELARKACLSQPQIARLESGQNELTYDTMRRIANVLEVEPWQLLPEDMQPKIMLPIIEEKEMSKLLTPFRFIGYGIRNILAFILRNCFNCMVIYPKKKGKKNAK